MVTFIDSRGNKVSFWIKDIKKVIEFHDSYYPSLKSVICFIDGSSQNVKEDHDEVLNILNEGISKDEGSEAD